MFRNYLIVFAVAAGVTTAVTPVMAWLGRRLGIMTPPDDRRVHEVATPELGGAAMYAGFLAAIVVAGRLSGFRPVFAGNSEPLMLVLAATVIFAVGTIDDLRDISPPAKTAGMVLTAGVLYLGGISIQFFRIPFVTTVSLSNDLIPLVSAVWLAGMLNAVNFIDGLDGLAAGIVAIAAASFFAYTHRLSSVGVITADNPSLMVCVVTAGICVGFLPWNWHPARIFMGDAGALLLGTLMASATMIVGGRTDTPFSGQAYFFFAPLAIPLVILGVPILDTAWAIIRRSRSGVSRSAADKGHLHHRLMRLGHGQRRSVLILWTWTALLSALVLWPTYTGSGDAIVPLGVAALGLSLYTLLHPQVREERRQQADLAKRDSQRGHPSAGVADDD